MYYTTLYLVTTTSICIEIHSNNVEDCSSTLLSQHIRVRHRRTDPWFQGLHLLKIMLLCKYAEIGHQYLKENIGSIIIVWYSCRSKHRWLVIWMSTEQKGTKREINYQCHKKINSIWKQIAIKSYTVAISLQSKTVWVAFSIFIHFFYPFMMNFKPKVWII